MRMFVLSLLVIGGGASVAWSQAAQNAAQPTTFNPKNFSGKVTPHVINDLRMTRYTFDPGARTNWHSHEGGQVIIIEQGRMRTQERSGSSKEFGPRETYVVAAGITHWHGALPGDPLTQVALSYGVTTWMEPVTDAQYASAARK
jgi:quercetin dioxygenase-like cupin family protein